MYKLEELYELVVLETENEIKELKYLLNFKKEKSKMQKLAKLERTLELITRFHSLCI